VARPGFGRGQVWGGACGSTSSAWAGPGLGAERRYEVGWEREVRAVEEGGDHGKGGQCGMGAVA
jgi:hypothetical protein